MNTRALDPQKNYGLTSMTIPTIAVIGEILANCFIIWFLLIDFPARCSRLATETGGQQTCGMETGAYVIASISALMIFAGIYFLGKWYIPQGE